MSSNQSASADASERVLMIVRDGSRDQDLMLREEVFVMRDMIAAAGYAVDVATVHDQPLAGDGVELTPDLALDAIDIAAYRGLMLPCMAPEPGSAMADNIVDLIRRAVDGGLALGAMRGSVREIARAGGLNGRRYSYLGAPDRDKNPEFQGAEFVDPGVTQDKNVATAGICPLAAQKSGAPDATAQLTDAFLEILREADA